MLMNALGSNTKMAAIKKEYASHIPTPKTEPVAPPAEKKEEKKANPWLAHVKEFRASHPELSFKEVLKQAKGVYTKVPKKSKKPDTTSV
jgi:hypothetical protein